MDIVRDEVAQGGRSSSFQGRSHNPPMPLSPSGPERAMVRIMKNRLHSVDLVEVEGTNRDTDDMDADAEVAKRSCEQQVSSDAL